MAMETNFGYVYEQLVLVEGPVVDEVVDDMVLKYIRTMVKYVTGDGK